MPYLANCRIGVVKMERGARIAFPNTRTKSVLLSDVSPLDNNQTMITIGRVRVGFLERFHTVEKCVGRDNHVLVSLARRSIRLSISRFRLCIQFHSVRKYSS